MLFNEEKLKKGTSAVMNVMGACDLDPLEQVQVLGAAIQTVGMGMSLTYDVTPKQGDELREAFGELLSKMADKHPEGQEEA